MPHSPTGLPTQKVDLLVIGFGKAGKTVAMKRAAAGDRVALIERSPQMYGGTCINIGCVPTKTLITDAERFVARTAGTEGEDAAGSGAGSVAGASADAAVADSAFQSARTRRDTLIAKLNAANKKMAEGKGVTVIDGVAHFTDSHTVRVSAAEDGADQLEITASTIIVNTGATPVWPSIPGLGSAEDARTGTGSIVDSTGIQFLPKRPSRLAIIGGGPIGLEFATLYSSLGTEVTILDASESFLPRVEPDIAAAVREHLVEQGITILLGATVSELSTSADSGAAVTVTATVDSETRAIDADVVLVAIGRRPATDGLGLEAAGINVTERGAIAVDDHLRTSVDGVYAAGDVAGSPQFTYISYDDHRVILDDRWGEGQRSTEGRVVPTATFINPPLATIGLTVEQARKDAESSGHVVRVASANVMDLPIVPRPKILARPAGRVTFVVDDTTDRLLGATLWCDEAHELINTVSLAMAADVPASTIGNGIYTHPTMSEIFNALLGN